MQRSRPVAALVAAGIAFLGLLTPSNAQATPGGRAVILVPGYASTARIDSTVGQSLTNAGFTVFPAEVGNMTMPLRDAATLVTRQARALRADGYQTVDLVGFSAGGVVTRAVISAQPRTPDGRRLIRTAVAVGSALNGTDLAALGPGWVEACIHPACWDLKPTSPFMTSLPPLPTGPGSTPLFSLWTQDDLVNLPVSASILPGAVNVHLQAVCPGVVGTWVGHESLDHQAFADLATQALTPGNARTSAYGCVLGPAA